MSLQGMNCVSVGKRGCLQCCCSWFFLNYLYWAKWHMLFTVCLCKTKQACVWGCCSELVYNSRCRNSNNSIVENLEWIFISQTVLFWLFHYYCIFLLDNYRFRSATWNKQGIEGKIVRFRSGRVKDMVRDRDRVSVRDRDRWSEPDRRSEAINFGTC